MRGGGTLARMAERAWIAYCKHCRYDLTGLQDEGKCPECGHYFSVTTRRNVIGAPTPQDKVDRVLARVRTIAVASLGAMILVCGGITTIVQRDACALAWGLLIGSVFLLGAAVSYAYETPET